MKHTQGQWTVKENNMAEVTIEAINENGVMDVMAQVFTVNQEEAIANANLIASAPEMLEMLKYTLRYFQDSTNMEGLEMYENLIAKAEGSHTDES